MSVILACRQNTEAGGDALYAIPNKWTLTIKQNVELRYRVWKSIFWLSRDTPRLWMACGFPAIERPINFAGSSTKSHRNWASVGEVPKAAPTAYGRSRIHQVVDLVAM